MKTRILAYFKTVNDLTVDGDPDKITRYLNTVNRVKEYFIKRDLDAFFSPPMQQDEVPSLEWKDVWLIRAKN